LSAPARFCDGIHERLPWHRCAEIHVPLATPMSCHRYCTPLSSRPRYSECSLRTRTLGHEDRPLLDDRV